MGFKMEKLNLDLGSTPIENIFINDFMPMGDGVCVKVYLLAYKYTSEEIPIGKITNQTLATNLNIPLSDVLRAWDFWEDKGIVKKHFLSYDTNDYDIEFLNLKRLYIDNLYKPKKSLSTPYDEACTLDYDEVIKLANVPEINLMFKEIRTLLNRYVTPDEQKRILEWRASYGCTTDLIFRAFEIAKDRDKGMIYVHSIIRNWFDEGITNMELLDAYLEANNERYRLYKKIFKQLGISSRPSEVQRTYMNTWIENWSFSIELILEACDQAMIKTNEPSFPYIDAILKKWFEKSITTLDDVAREQAAHEESTAAEKVSRSETSRVGGQNTKVKTKLHNFKQWTDDLSPKELEDLFRDN